MATAPLSETLITMPSVQPATTAASFYTVVTPENMREILNKLEAPFDPAVIEWRTCGPGRVSGTKQLVAYAPKEAYIQRLNEVLTPAGWSRKFSFEFMANISRIVKADNKPQVLNSGKVRITCDLTLNGIQTHSTNGEMWADDDNAVTSAEAQGFKRACSLFGVGAYIERIPKQELPYEALTKGGKPKVPPVLPSFADPEGKTRRDRGGDRNQPPQGQSGQPPQAQTRQQPQGRQQPPQIQTRAQAQPGQPAAVPTELQMLHNNAKRDLGDLLYKEVCARADRLAKEGNLSDLTAAHRKADSLKAALAMLSSVREMAGMVPDAVFFGVLEGHGIERLDAIPSRMSLATLHESLLKAVKDIRS